MRAVIESEAGIRAELSGGGWVCEDSELQQMLNSMFPYPDPDFPHYDPNPIARIAKKAAEQLRWNVTSLPKTPYKDGQVY